MKNVLLFVALLIGSISYSQNNLVFDKILSFTVDTSLSIQDPCYSCTTDLSAELFVYEVPDSHAIKINNIIEADLIGSSNQTGVSSKLLINGKRIDFDEVKGLWLQSGEEISIYIYLWTTNTDGYSSANYEIPFVISLTEYLLTPH